MALGSIYSVPHGVSQDPYIEIRNTNVALGTAGGLDPLTPQCFSPIPGLPWGQRGTPDFSFLAFSAVPRLYQGFMYVRPVLYMSYIPSPCMTCALVRT